MLTQVGFVDMNTHLYHEEFMHIGFIEASELQGDSSKLAAMTAQIESEYGADAKRAKQLIKALTMIVDKGEAAVVKWNTFIGEPMPVGLLGRLRAIN